jgi:hypothetical protein
MITSWARPETVAIYFWWLCEAEYGLRAAHGRRTTTSLLGGV